MRVDHKAWRTASRFLTGGADPSSSSRQPREVLACRVRQDDPSARREVPQTLPSIGHLGLLSTRAPERESPPAESDACRPRAYSLPIATAPLAWSYPDRAADG